MSKSTENSGAQLSSGSTLTSRFQMTVRQHQVECSQGIKEIFLAPFSSFMTIAVIAIALALPAGFHVFLKNAKSVSANWDNASQISLYLQKSVSLADIDDIKSTLSKSAKISHVEFISSNQGLEDFKVLSGFGDALALLDDNPIPHTLIVTPSIAHSTPEASSLLMEELQSIKEVELAQLDLQWVRKLYSMMDIAERAVSALGLLLGLAVLLIIGNTIRLAIQNKREEIQIIKLVGATDGFIRRPFLYNGMWYGIFSGLLAWCFISINIYWLSDPIQHLAGQYDSDFTIQNLSFIEVIQMIGLSTLLGWLGSWLSVGRHIRDIEPR